VLYKIDATNEHVNANKHVTTTKGVPVRQVISLDFD
jgi:hypothetical protein